MVTAEMAVVVPALLLVLACCLTGLALAVDQVRCADAARVGARAASRGDPAAEVRRVVSELAPHGSHVRVDRSQGVVTVTVTAPSRAALLPGLPRGSGTATAQLEPYAGGAP